MSACAVSRRGPRASFRRVVVLGLLACVAGGWSPAAHGQTSKPLPDPTPPQTPNPPFTVYTVQDKGLAVKYVATSDLVATSPGGPILARYHFGLADVPPATGAGTASPPAGAPAKPVLTLTLVANDPAAGKVTAPIRVRITASYNAMSKAYATPKPTAPQDNKYAVDVTPIFQNLLNDISNLPGSVNPEPPLMLDDLVKIAVFTDPAGQPDGDTPCNNGSIPVTFVRVLGTTEPAPASAAAGPGAPAQAAADAGKPQPAAAKPEGYSLVTATLPVPFRASRGPADLFARYVVVPARDLETPIQMVIEGTGGGLPLTNPIKAVLSYKLYGITGKFTTDRIKPDDKGVYTIDLTPFAQGLLDEVNVLSMMGWFVDSLHQDATSVPRLFPIRLDDVVTVTVIPVRPDAAKPVPAADKAAAKNADPGPAGQEAPKGPQPQPVKDGTLTVKLIPTLGNSAP